MAITLAGLKKQKAALRTKMQSFLDAIKENETMSAEQKTEYGNMKSQFDDLKDQISLIDGSDDEDGEEGGGAPLAAAHKVQNGGHPRPGGDPAKKDFESLEDFVMAVVRGGTDPRLANLYKDNVHAEQRMDDGPSGGWMVPPQFRTDLQVREPEKALVRPLATVIPAGNPPDAEIILPALDQGRDSSGNTKVFGGIAIAKVAEGGLKPETDFDVRGVSLKPVEMAGFVSFTDKLLRNAPAAKAWAAQLLRGAVNSYEDFQFLTGVGAPEGMINSSAAYLHPRQTGGTITFLDLKNMISHFSGDLSKARWVVSYAGFLALLSLVGDGGGATNIIAVDQSTGQVTIYGIPLARHMHLPALGTKGDFLLADMSKYLIKDGSGPFLEVGYAAGQWERNKQALKITWNVDGRMWQKEPWKDEAGFETSSVVVLN